MRFLYNIGCSGQWCGGGGSAAVRRATVRGCGHKKVKCFLSHHKEGEKSLPIVEVDFKYIKSNAKAVLSTLLLLLSVAYRLDCNLCKQIAMFYGSVVSKQSVRPFHLILFSFSYLVFRFVISDDK